MNELKNVSKDVYNGALPPSQWLGFALYQITHNLGCLSIVVVLAFGFAWVLTH